MKKPLFLALSLAALASCSGGNDKPAAETPVAAEKPQTCTYAFNPEAKSEILWVAYKYTEKTGVKGVFEGFNVSGTGSGTTVSDVLNGASVTIGTATLNSNDATRDPKIKDAFFGSLTDGDNITGRILSVDESTATVALEVGMNGTTQTVSGGYTLTDNKLEIKFEMNVADWGAQGGIDALNKVCSDLHKGTDGKSVLWPDVTVFVSTELAKDCQ